MLAHPTHPQPPTGMTRGGPDDDDDSNGGGVRGVVATRVMVPLLVDFLPYSPFPHALYRIPRMHRCWLSKTSDATSAGLAQGRGTTVNTSTNTAQPYLQAGSLRRLRQRAGERAVAQWAMAVICNTRVEHDTITHSTVVNARGAGAEGKPGVADLAVIPGDLVQLDNSTCNAANGGCEQGGEWKRATSNKTPRPGGRLTMTPGLRAGSLMRLRQRAGD